MHNKKVVSINNLENPNAAQEKILKGANFLADAVKLTLGNHGRNFLMEKGLKITNDGISIAKEIQLDDEIEDLGLRVAREAAIKTNDKAGDGTTTSLTLMQSILKEATRLLPGKKLIGKKSAMQVKKQLEKECVEVVEKLGKMATPIKSEEELIQVARVSVEDEELAKIIGKAQWELGKDGVLVAEDTNDKTDSVEKINGIRFDNGLGTSLVINNPEKQRLEVDKPAVIMMNYTLETISPILKVINELVKNGKRDIIIVARAFSSVAIKDCMANNENGIRLYPVNAPYVNQGEIMRDLVSVVGGKFFDQEETDLEDITFQDVGFAKRVICERYSAIITGENDEQSETRVKNRVNELTKAIEGEQSVFQKNAIKTRISQLTNGFGLIKVGSISEADRKYKYDKVEDAVNTVKSALQEGTVRGAGLAYKEISDAMPDDSILKRPLLAPYQQIMDNAGEVFDVEEWVRDSVKVVRVGLEQACQIAADLATAGGAIATARPKELDSLLNKK